MEREFISHSAEETKEFAKSFALALKPGDVICLDGDLGAGKTAFVQGMAKGMGIDDYITSPTFTIVNEYYGTMPLYHFDVYRIAESEEMYEIGYDEYITGDGVCVIEWADIISDILPDERYEIDIQKDYDRGENYRRFTIKKIGSEEL